MIKILVSSWLSSVSFHSSSLSPPQSWSFSPSSPSWLNYLPCSSSTFTCSSPTPNPHHSHHHDSIICRVHHQPPTLNTHKHYHLKAKRIFPFVRSLPGSLTSFLCFPPKLRSLWPYSVFTLNEEQCINLVWSSVIGRFRYY